jgi:hypothetical protein
MRGPGTGRTTRARQSLQTTASFTQTVRATLVFAGLVVAVLATLAAPVVVASAVGGAVTGAVGVRLFSRYAVTPETADHRRLRVPGTNIRLRL